MSSRMIDVEEARDQLAELVAQAAAGMEIVLTEGAQPRARLVPVASARGPHVPGLHPGSMVMSEDFDAPLPDEFWTGAPQRSVRPNPGCAGAH